MTGRRWHGIYLILFGGNGENSPCALNAIPQACQQAGVTTIINVLFKE